MVFFIPRLVLLMCTTKHATSQKNFQDQIDLARACAKVETEFLWDFKRKWYACRLPQEVVSDACRGRISFRFLSVRGWGKKLCKYFFRIYVHDKDQEAEKRKRFLEFVNYINVNAHGLLLGRLGGSNAHSNGLWVDALIRIFTCEERWIRSIDQWNPPRTKNKEVLYRNLINHLFLPYQKNRREYYHLAEYAYCYWDAPRERGYWGRKVEKAMFFQLAQGNNLRSLSDLSVKLTRKQERLVLSTPTPVPLQTAIIEACIRDLGGSRELADEFNKIWYVRNLVGVEKTAEKREADRTKFSFWLSVMHFFVRYPELVPDQVREVCDYINHVQCENAARRADAGRVVPDREQEPVRVPHLADFTMKGRSPRALMRQVERWHEELGRKRDDKKITFAGSKLPSFWMPVEEKQDWFWRIYELLSSEDLAIESQKMKHCVYSYANAAACGKSHIFTLEAYLIADDDWGEVIKHLTIEVNPKKEIVQIRGKANVRASKEEKVVLKEWARCLNLTIP